MKIFRSHRCLFCFYSSSKRSNEIGAANGGRGNGDPSRSSAPGAPSLKGGSECPLRFHPPRVHSQGPGATRYWPKSTGYCGGGAAQPLSCEF